MKAAHARDDASEMYAILRSARCIARYDCISHQLLAEILVAVATGGEVVGGNNRGSDVLSPGFGKIEVKSRILGTDGPFPRVSLKAHNVEKADWVAAVRWTRTFDFHDAVALPRDAIHPLVEGRLNAARATHISWQSWTASPAARSLSDEIRAALNGT